MNTAGQLRRQCLIDEALTRDTAEAGKRRRNDFDREMGLAALPCPARVTGMAYVPVGFVGDAQPDRREALGQLPAHRVGDAHDRAARSNSTAAPRNPARSSTT